MCVLLRLPPETMSTALKTFHRYCAVARHEEERERDGMSEAACVLVACKAEETPRKVREVASVALTVRRGSVQSCITQEYWAARAVLVRRETAVLRALGFDVPADGAAVFVAVLHCVAALAGTRSPEAGRLAQLSWAVVSDAMLLPALHGGGSVSSSLAVAAGSVAFAASLLGITLQDARWRRPWWASLGVTEPALAQVVCSLESLYRRPSSSNHPRAEKE
jgi:hypothetical protein